MLDLRVSYKAIVSNPNVTITIAVVKRNDVAKETCSLVWLKGNVCDDDILAEYQSRTCIGKTSHRSANKLGSRYRYSDRIFEPENRIAKRFYRMVNLIESGTIQFNIIDKTN